MGNWTTDSKTDYRNIYLVRDAKHFPKNAKGPAATFLTFVHGTKDGEDIYIDARAVRGAELLANHRKGDIVSIRGRVDFYRGDDGVLRGKIWDADVASLVKLKDRTPSTSASAAPAAPDAPDTEGMGPAFD